MASRIEHNNDTEVIKSSENLLLGRSRHDSGSGTTVSLRSQICSTRFQLAIMGFMGFFLVYAMRVNLNVALVDMVKDTDANSTDVNNNCPVTSSLNDTSDDSGTFAWSSTEQANILGAFYYGYLFAQIPGSIVAAKYGGKVPYGLGILCTALLNLLTPAVSHLGAQWLVALRVAEGVTEASTYPAFNQLMGVWVPKLERSTFSTFSTSGATFGNVVAQPVIGFICTFKLLDGWPLGFYLTGVLGILWFFGWMYLVYNSPQEHPWISEEEKMFIISNTVPIERIKPNIPWMDIARCRPFYAIAICQFCANFVVYGIMTCLPQYLSDVLNFDISSDGFLSGLPWLFCWFGTLGFANLTDFIRRRNWVSTTFIRKANQFTGSVMPGIFLVLAGYAGCNSTQAVSFIVFAMFMYGANYSGFFCNNLDLAPNFAGVLYALTNSFATIPGFVAPIVVDQLTKSNVHSEVLWRTVFFAFAGVGCFGGVAFVLLGSGEMQPWAVKECPEDIQTFLSDGLHGEQNDSERSCGSSDGAKS